MVDRAAGASARAALPFQDGLTGSIAVPTYSYECSKCAHVQDVFHAMSASPRIKCEQCGGRTNRLIGKGAGIIFKGSGFYETDFKEKKGTPPSKEKKTAEKGKDKSEGKSESKSTSKPEKSSGAKKESKGKAKA